MTISTRDTESIRGARGRAPEPAPALVVAWARGEADRAGEVLGPLEIGQPAVFGRGKPERDDPHPRAMLLRQRPGQEHARALDSEYVSKVQLRVTLGDGEILVENMGKRALLDDGGRTVDSLRVRPGGAFEVKGQLVFVCVTRPPELASLRSIKIAGGHAFGGPDALGIVGESPAAWALRDQLAFVAGRRAHVLLLGESGVGKELVARGLHALSDRKGKALVARNAATLPSGIADAELFGNVANYPNSGTPERAGLVGEAHGSTLFLDEIGELPEALQTKLLRVLDEEGDYQRLGDAKRRRSDLRFVAATNRPVEALKHDLAARLRLRLTVPSLAARREDVMPIAAHLMRRIAQGDEHVAQRFLRGGAPAIDPALVRALVRHDFPTNARELEGLLWTSMSTSSGDELALTMEVQAERDHRASQPPAADARTIGAEELREALEKHGGVREKVWRELGLANRFVLVRLLKKHGLA